jgi:Leucine-rich repeat (LRR) protein
VGELNPLVGTPAPSPQIKSWDLNVPSEVLGILDLTEAVNLGLSFKGFRDYLEANSIPSQLTTLRLSHVSLGPDTPLAHNPQLMPHLIGFMITDSLVQDRLQDYLLCPKLKSLYLDQVGFYTIEKNQPAALITLVDAPLSHSASFPSLPGLESLYLRCMELDDKLPAALQSCPLLQRISTQFCVINDFARSFTTTITDSKNLPALEGLRIDSPFEVEESWSLEEFALGCIRRRPELTVYSDDMVFGDAS